MQNLWDYSKRGKDLSASNLAASQRRIEQEQYDKDNAFNPVNAAVAAAVAYFTGGASLTIPNVATSALAAATAPRGKEDIAGSALGGYTKTSGLQDIGSAIDKGGIQSLATPENASKVIGTVQAWQNKPMEAYASLSQPAPKKELSDFDKTMLNVYTNILSSDKSTDQAKSEAAKGISKIYNIGKLNISNLTGGIQQPQQPEQMVTNFPQGTQQPFQNTTPAVQNIIPQLQQMMRPQEPQAPSPPEGEIFSPTMFQTKPDEKEQLAIEKARAESKAMKAKEALQPIYNQLSNKITQATDANDFDRLNRVLKQASTELSGSKEMQDDISKQVSASLKVLYDRGYKMTQDQFNRSIATSNLEIRDELLKLRKDSIKSANSRNKTIPIGAVQDLSEMKSSVKLLDDLVSKVNNGKIGPVKSIARYNPYDSDVQEFNQMVASIKQVIGKSLEGGVLRLEDEKKYEKIIPKITDTKQTLIKKATNLRRLIEIKHNDALTEFENAEYKTGEIQPINSVSYSMNGTKQKSNTGFVNGKIYVDKNGNRAKYMNGKFVEVR